MKFKCEKCGSEPAQTEEDKKQSKNGWKVYSSLTCPKCGGDCVPVAVTTKRKKR